MTGRRLPCLASLMLLLLLCWFCWPVMCAVAEASLPRQPLSGQHTSSSVLSSSKFSMKPISSGQSRRHRRVLNPSGLPRGSVWRARLRSAARLPLFLSTSFFVFVFTFFRCFVTVFHIGLPSQGSGENRRGHRGENHGRAAVLRRDHPRGPVRRAKVAPSSDRGGGAHHDDREPRVHVLSHGRVVYSEWWEGGGKRGWLGFVVTYTCKVGFANVVQKFWTKAVLVFERMRTRAPPSYKA